ncbi:uncharacterized protein K02A2.6-like [Dendronephthya gigantea]|uniref:uncharacterized protein K02A2.6-like n=1 Tax=Dendronephthya gigantea TaxID=151771 RepID=UPI0010697EE4|nr:uncharacterized protein K02A2.6-like [Dendronephthya gigantea]
MDTLSTTIVDKTRVHFARFCIPRICHTDNGPQFVARAYKEFSKEYNFHHTTSSPYHPQGNGRAEAAVKLVKNMIKKTDDFQAALLNYRNTPQRGHSYSPVQRMLCRRTRTKLPTTNKVLVPRMINRTMIQEDLERKRNTSKTYYDGAVGPQHSTLRPGQYAYARPPPQRRGKPWIYGQFISEQPSRSYMLKTRKGVIRRNRVHIIPTTPLLTDSGPISQKKESSTHMETTPIILPSRPPKKEITTTQDRQEPSTPTVTHEPSTTIPSPIPPTPIPQPELSRRPTRTRRMPERLKDYVLNGLEQLLR